MIDRQLIIVTVRTKESERKKERKNGIPWSQSEKTKECTGFNTRAMGIVVNVRFALGTAGIV